MTWKYNELRQVGVDFENFDQVAQYDLKQGSDRGTERRLVERFCVSPGQVVVDLGCGTGSFALEAARVGASVRAVDVSRTMLDFVHDAASREGLSNLEIEHAGFLTFKAPKSSIDLVVSRFALHHLPDFWKQVALIRLNDVLRPAGRLYVQDVVFSFDVETYDIAIEDWVSRMPKESGFSRTEFETHVREEYSTFAWVLEGFFDRAGFDILDKMYFSQEYAEYVCGPKIFTA